ncbi:MAG: hypothetical protein C0596_17775 [Marinilabiliales bacterium]|mgnify:CR=1 FL=1|nr:MAG: hypothetical protein C0596_17775 [Marinilabiliales bacterium]
MKSIVYFYSKKGNNEFIANKLAKELNCDIEKIRPRADVFFFYLIKLNFGIKKLINNPSDYDRIFLVGPVWMGRFICPLKSFIKKYMDQINSLYFVTCCGSGDEVKYEKFGHGHVFNEIKNILGNKLIRCDAMPIGLILPEDKRKDGDSVMKARLKESNFTNEIKARFDKYISDIN